MSQQLWTPFNGIIFNLILNELAASCISVPLDMISSVNHGWSLGKAFCYVSGVIHTMAGERATNKPPVFSQIRINPVTVDIG